MLMHRSQHCCIEREELKILCWSLSWRKKIDPCICHYGPVAMLAGTVHTVERLFMENDFQMMLFSYLLHDDHKHHVLVYGLYSLTEFRRTFELVRCNLVMAGLKQNSELICLSLKVLHEGTHLRRDGTEVMVLELLVLRRCMSYHRPAA